MESIIHKIDSLVQSLSELQPINPEYQEKLDRKIRLEFNYNSNHIEGNTLTYGETELLLIFDKTTGNHELREYEEMKAHDVAFELIKDWATDKERPLSEMGIKNINEILLVRPFWKEAQTADSQPTRRLIKVGEYKEYPNSVRLQNGEIFAYASPQETPILMGELIQWYRDEEEKGELHPGALAALFHYKFVRIHPFDDGNGRISRLLMNYVLLKHHLPPVIIKSTDKKNYLFALNQADTGNIDAFIQYVANQLLWSLEINIKAAKGESVEEKGDLDKKIHLLKRKLGEDVNTSIQLMYSEEAIIKVIKEVVIPLAHNWEQRLKAFETFFISRAMRFYSENSNYASPIYIETHFDDAFDNFCERFMQSKTVKEHNLRELSMHCTAKGLRTIDNNIIFDGGEIIINFFKNTYEITYTNGAQKYNKLYHQLLREGEMENIIDSLGNWLYKIINETVNADKT